MDLTKDPQLSKLLREWQVGDAPLGLDARVLGARKPLRRFPVPWSALAIVLRSRKTLWAAALAGMLFLIVVTEAIPQTLKLISPPAPPPYSVDAEYIRYAEDGLPAVEMLSTSYIGPNGSEVILQRTIPGHPLGTALGRTLDAILPFLSRLTTPILVPAKELEKFNRSASHNTIGVISGCEEKTCLAVDHWFFARAESGPNAPCAAGAVVGQATILGHSTIAIERPLPNPRSTPSHPAASKITMWMAPDLGCFALKLSVEDDRPDGTLRLVSERQALRITNP